MSETTKKNNSTTTTKPKRKRKAKSQTRNQKPVQLSYSEYDAIIREVFKTQGLDNTTMREFTFDKRVKGETTKVTETLPIRIVDVNMMGHVGFNVYIGEGVRSADNVIRVFLPREALVPPVTGFKSDEGVQEIVGVLEEIHEAYFKNPELIYGKDYGVNASTLYVYLQKRGVRIRQSEISEHLRFISQEAKNSVGAMVRNFNPSRSDFTKVATVIAQYARRKARKV